MTYVQSAGPDQIGHGGDHIHMTWSHFSIRGVHHTAGLGGGNCRIACRQLLIFASIAKPDVWNGIVGPEAACFDLSRIRAEVGSEGAARSRRTSRPPTWRSSAVVGLRCRHEPCPTKCPRNSVVTCRRLSSADYIVSGQAVNRRLGSCHAWARTGFTRLRSWVRVPQRPPGNSSVNVQLRDWFADPPQCTSLTLKNGLVPLRVARVWHDIPALRIRSRARAHPTNGTRAFGAQHFAHGRNGGTISVDAHPDEEERQRPAIDLLAHDICGPTVSSTP